MQKCLKQLNNVYSGRAAPQHAGDDLLVMFKSQQFSECLFKALKYKRSFRFTILSASFPPRFVLLSTYLLCLFQKLTIINIFFCLS